MIPAWLPTGVLPPTLSATNENRSPYRVSMLELVQRFSSSVERTSILEGLIELRARLRARGLIQGFQWINGSFVEHVEVTEQRPPEDVDVVTFAHLGGPAGQKALCKQEPDLFARALVRDRHRVDHYWVDLDIGSDPRFVRSVTYWYSMWSHRRDGLWKGFVQLDLGEDDNAAVSELAKIAAGGNE